MRLAASLRRFALLAACLIPLALATAARAADADQIRDDLKTVLEEQFSTGPDSGFAYSTIEVEGAAAPYTVSIRDIMLGSAMEGFAEVGTITFMVSPAGEGLYDVSDLKLPTSITHTASDQAFVDPGKVDATIEIGAQSFKGVWSMPLRSFLSFDGSLENLTAKDGKGIQVVEIGKIKIDGDSTETSPGRWDQVGKAVVSDMNVNGPEADDDHVAIAELSVETRANGIDVAAFDALMQKIEDAGKAVESEWQRTDEEIENEGAATEDMPVEDMPPAEDTMAPAEDTNAPADDAAATGDDTTAPADDTAATGDDTTAPAEAANAAADDTAATGDDTTAPAEDASAATDDTTATGDDTTAPVEGDAAAEAAADPNAGAEQATSEAAGEEPLADTPPVEAPPAEEVGGEMGETMPEEAAPDDMTMPPDMEMGGMSPVQAKAMQDMMEALQAIPGSIGDLSSKIGLRGLVVRAADGTEVFRLDNGALEFAATGLDQEKAGLRFAYNHAGLDADWNIFNEEDDYDSYYPEPDASQDSAGQDSTTEEAPPPEGLDAKTKELIDQLAPREFAVDVQFDDVPSKEIWNTFISTMYSSASTGGPSDMEMGMMGMMLPMILAQAGSSVRIVDSKVVSEAATVDFDGSVKADSASMMGASGTMTVEVTGLDRVIELVKNYVGPEGAADVAPLEMLRAFGERTEAGGTTVDRYLITLEPNGALMVNGKDMNFLLGMGEPPPQ